MSEHHPIQDLMNGTVEKIKSMIDANTVVGTPITTADGTTVIPVSRVTIGFGSGGSDFQSRHSKETTPLSFGGGGGAGVSVTPVCFLVISPTEGTHVLGINAQAVNTADPPGGDDSGRGSARSRAFLPSAWARTTPQTRAPCRTARSRKNRKKIPSLPHISPNLLVCYMGRFSFSRKTSWEGRKCEDGGQGSLWGWHLCLCCAAGRRRSVHRAPSSWTRTRGATRFAHNADAVLPMASTTKIMTAIVAIEQGDLDRVYTVKPAYTQTEGSSMYLKPGERLTIRDTLYGLMLMSGNDAALAIAGECGGQEAFVQAMNDKAAALGLTHTHFENPNGLDGETHHTTARELAQLTAYALQNPDFREIVGTQTTTRGRAYDDQS